MSFSTSWTQFFPPRDGAPLTEANLPNQSGKVFIVTGGSSGIGYELSRILYGAGGKVYMLTRSKEHAEDAISRIKVHYAGNSDKSTKTGSLEFIYMDLADFTTVKTAAQQFLDREGPDGRLDILFNNAGTGSMKNAPPTPQGHEYHFSTNSLGHHLLTRLLTPILSQTAKTAPKDSVRVVWAASVLVELMSPKEGVRKEYLQDPFSIKDPNELYASSKVANWFLASEFARRQSSEAGAFGVGVVHLAGNPGNYSTGIWRTVPSWLTFVVSPILRDPVHGAETFMWIAFSDEVTMPDAVAGRYAMCDGRWHPGQRADLVVGLKGEEEGGSGRAREYFEWCEERVKEFLV
ncbi:putative steroid dehydrogenase [Hypoxylon rubiginosum]|uniref:Steroid dehydrogenase n=1 Tax=Hypoxylon rubiginosum TaxID=110542 RepID=A0ACB9YVN1_9PEZI|nr:putative steroid dehydrogenase [Hypoxylon rubiginosum]